MSRSFPHNIKCPHCSNEQETIVWESLNVTVEPELKEKLFKGEINLFSCTNCVKEGNLPVSLLYHDMDKDFSVHYFPRDSLDDPDFYQYFNPDSSLAKPKGTKPMPKSTAYLSKPHIVFDLNEMLRYVVFRDRLAEVNRNTG